MIQFTPALEYPIRIVSNFFENSRRHSQVNVHHPYQRHQRKFATGINDTGSKFCHQFTSVVDTAGKFATGVNDTGSKPWEQNQAADTLKWTWRQKFTYSLC